LISFWPGLLLTIIFGLMTMTGFPKMCIMAIILSHIFFSFTASRFPRYFLSFLLMGPISTIHIITLLSISVYLLGNKYGIVGYVRYGIVLQSLIFILIGWLYMHWRWPKVFKSLTESKILDLENARVEISFGWLSIPGDWEKRRFLSSQGFYIVLVGICIITAKLLVIFLPKIDLLMVFSCIAAAFMAYLLGISLYTLYRFSRWMIENKRMIYTQWDK